MAKDTVIVLKSVNYSEADKVLTVLGKYTGKFALFAKGIRKINSRNRGNMQTLSISDISFYEGRGLPVLTESQLIFSSDIDVVKDRVSDIKRVLDMINKIMQEGDPNTKIFNMLESLCRKNFDIESVNRFRLLFLKEMGYLSDFTVCSVCGTKKNLEYLDTSSFALLCKNCYSKRGSGIKIGGDIYRSREFSTALDVYIKKIIEEI